jgi:hypothetical protein
MEKQTRVKSGRTYAGDLIVCGRKWKPIKRLVVFKIILYRNTLGKDWSESKPEVEIV